MSEVESAKSGSDAMVALKIIYTLYGTDSQKYIVKPATPVNIRVFRELELGVVDIKPCLAAIREASPDFASICDTHSDEYAVYSADYAEEDMPLQSHGKISQEIMVEATGRLGLSKLKREELELLIHLLPVRRPDEMIAEYHHHQKLKSDSVVGPSSDFMTSARTMLPFPPPPPSLANPSFMPSLAPPHIPLPHSLASTPAMKSDSALPSSPPVRAKPNKIASMGNHLPPIHQTLTSSAGDDIARQGYAVANTAANSLSQVNAATTSASNAAAKYPARRASPENSTSKKRKATSPKNETAAQCGNCGVADASTWRRARCPDGKGELLCNACGLYYRSKKVMRPRFLWDKGRSRSNQEAMNAATSIDLATQQALTMANAEPSSSSSSTSSSNLSMPLQPLHPPSANLAIDDSEDVGAALWSRKRALDFMGSDAADISDRLIDDVTHPPKREQSQLQASPMDTNGSRDQHSQGHRHRQQQQQQQRQQQQQQQQQQQDQLQQGSDNSRDGSYDSSEQFLVPPSTPQRKTNLVPLEPDSMQKWLGLTTPEQRFALMIPGSGSARKWLDKALNPTNFDEVWNSPTPKHSKSTIPDLAMFTSSPPTSSNMLSEVAEWNLSAASPGTPQVLKFYKPDEETHQQEMKEAPKIGELTQPRSEDHKLEASKKAKP